ncbi:MAG: universal stress protein [Bacteroidetes Order II. Incertae sedis bacterium]|nr:universal stress protein [Bacteroidetes Order II. bacterium]
MLTKAKLLIPIDRTDASYDLVPFARAFALEYGIREIHLVHVLPLNPPVGSLEPLLQATLPVSDLPVLQEESKTYLDQFAQKVLAGGFEVHQAVLYDWDVANALIRYTEDQQIDLVVMGTHGRKGLNRLLMGSVAEKVVREAPCPVLTVRPDANLVKPALIRRIVVPTDLSKHAKMAFKVSLHLAARHGAAIHLLHVVNEEGLPPFYDPYWNYNKSKEALRSKVYRLLTKFMEETEGPSVQVNRAIRFGQPEKEIIAFASGINADLIVIPTHGLTGLAHFLMGSITEKVLRNATIPVLTLKSFGKHISPLLAETPLPEESSPA